MSNEIILNSEELDGLAAEIETTVNNNNFLLDAIHVLKVSINEQALFGVEKDMHDKLEQYENYFSTYYVETLYQIQDNISSVGRTFDEQDIANGKGLI